MMLAIRAHDFGVTGIDAVCEKVHETGLDGIQLVAYKCTDLPYLPGALTEEIAASLGAKLAAEGIAVPLIGAYFNPVHSDAAKRERCKAIFKDYLRCARRLGGTIVGSETGSFNDDKWTYHPKNRTEEALASVTETFSELALYAKEQGVSIGVEGAFGHVCYEPKILRRMIDGIARDNVRVIFDLYNYMDASNADRYLDILDEGLDLFAGEIAVFHLKDCVLEGGKLRQVPVGRGMLDLDAILKRIFAAEPNAALVFEGTVKGDIPAAVKLIKEKTERIGL